MTEVHVTVDGRLEGDGTLRGFERLVVTTLRRIRIREIAVAPGSRKQLREALEVLRSLVEAAEVEEEDAVAIEAVGVLGPELDRFAVIRLRIPRPSSRLVHLGESHECVSVVRAQLQRAP